MDLKDEELIGKTILFGLTYVNPDQTVSGQVQIYGQITEIQDDGHTLVVACDYESHPWYLPLHKRSLMFAPRGSYKLSANNLVVHNPDFVTSWTVFLSPSGEDDRWSPNYAPFHAPVPKEWMFEDESDPVYLEELIEKYGSQYIGKRVLVGISHYQLQENGEPSLTDRTQFIGSIRSLRYPDGIVLWVPAQEKEFILPPDLTVLEPAKPMEYTLASTDEVVKDPDFIAIWEMMMPKTQSGAE